MLPISRSAHEGAETTNASGILHRSLKHLPLKVVGASGNYLTLSNGQKILDATGGAAVSCLGHGDKRVQDAITRQMSEVAYCHSLFFSTSAAEDLGQELVAGTNGAMTKAFIVSSGSEAIEAAMKLARQYHLELSPSQPQRTKFIARKESYHALFEPMLLENTSRVSACNTYRGKTDGESEQEYVARLAKELDDEFHRVGPETVCAFVAEPVVGAALGCVPSVAGYFEAVKAVCDKYGALLIMDEIMSGMGRTGTLHAWQQEGVVPDIQTIGKGLGGGYAPVAGVLINHRVVDVLQKGTGSFSHGQTYQGHPVACAAAAQVQRIIRDDSLCENVKKMGVYLEKLLKQRLADHPNVGDIRGRGLFWGIEFVKDKATKEPFDLGSGVAMGVHEKGMEPKYSISVYPGTGTADGKSGDHVLLAPAYNVTEADVEKIVDLTTGVITEFFGELQGKAVLG
ncbi:hypothetical protein SLS55_005271 [Diplodia seriata]|uniref:Aminotransferase n=1 Tax=Diplodia seriata TaxID=420778 RepID=A0ABR3CG77_9PEZI